MIQALIDGETNLRGLPSWRIGGSGARRDPARGAARRVTRRTASCSPSPQADRRPRRGHRRHRSGGRRACRAFRAAIAQLISIPGIGDLGACVILAEIGHDMSRFPTQRHLLSWAGLCPKNDESAGKRRSNGCARARLAEDHADPVCLGGSRKKGGNLQAQFHRLRARRGAKKAIGAVAASMLTSRHSPAPVQENEPVRRSLQSSKPESGAARTSDAEQYRLRN